MKADATLDELVDSVADGDLVDWAQLEAGDDESVLRLLAHLKTVATVAEVHRTPMADDLGATASGGDHLAGHLTGPLGELGELGRWGHLQLVRKIGEGSYGEVFHARDTWLDHPVALKLLRPDLSDRMPPNKLLDEARVLVKVCHPNVVAVHGADLQHGRVGFWMEFVQGQRLDDLVAFQGLLSAEDAAEIGQGLCSALSAVHDAGLVHRDVKAQNVIREPKGRVVLMDFGAGHLVADGAQGPGAGTPLYLAPEMFNGGHASAQTDIYALGVLLYYLVTAGYPVPARSIDELKDAHARGRQRPLHLARPGLPRSFTKVIDRMVAIDPGDRYATAADALADLRAFSAPASMARKIVVWTGRLTVTVIGITVLGLLNTATFDIVMGRAGRFSTESVTQWFRWGVSSLVAPAVYIAAAAIGLTVLIATARLLIRISPTAKSVAGHLRKTVRDFVTERGLDEVNLRVQSLIGAGALALGSLFLVYWECLAPVTLYINDTPTAALSILDPENEAAFDGYGQALDVFVFAYLLLLHRVLASARRQGEPVHRAIKVSAFMVPALALMMWEMPYRIAYHNAFMRVDAGEARCYELGRDASSLLLHCPDMAPPRNRIVPHAAADLRSRGVVESVFTPLGRSHPTH